jgi:hypothetical protein
MQPKIETLGTKPPPPKREEHRQSTQRLRIARGVANDLLVGKVTPTYSPEALDKRIQGAVLLKVEIDEEGVVKI